MDRRAMLLGWFPVLTRYGGFTGVVFVIGFWAMTGRFEPGILAFLGAMIGLGEGVDALKELAAAKTPPPAPPPVAPLPQEGDG